MTKVAINGFGPIGHNFLRASLERELSPKPARIHAQVTR
jgi:glyceraldehyde-3-phosphate dehydrogenase/erythrose-4-phosphate dehydrogenase